MKTIKSIITLLLISATFCQAQPAWQWVQSYGGDGSATNIIISGRNGNMILDANKNTYGAMQSDGNVTIDTSSYAGDCIAIYSHNCQGQTRWVRYITCGGIGPQLESYTNDKDGNVYLSVFLWADYFITPIVLDTNLSSFTLNNGGNFKHHVIIKIDSSGNRKWLQFPEPWSTNSAVHDSYKSYSMDLDINGNVDILMVVALSQQIGSTLIPLGDSLSRYRILKVNKLSGNLISLVKLDIKLLTWASLGNEPKLISYNNAYYIKGLLPDSTIFGTTMLVQSEAYSNAYCIFKCLSNGTVAWVKGTDNPVSLNKNLEFTQPVISGNKLIIPILYSNNPVYEGIMPINNAPNALVANAFFAHDTLDGHVLWHNVEQGMLSEVKAITSANGKLYVGEYYAGQVYYTGANGNDTIQPSYGITNQVFKSITCLNDGTGAYVWSSGVKSSLYNSLRAMAADDAGNVYVEGLLSDSIYTTAGVGVGAMGHSYQLFLAKIAPSNNCNCVMTQVMPNTVSQLGNTINVSGTAIGSVDSLYWFWGDGSKTKYLIQGTIATHTYATEGNYTACLKAYSSCGTKDSCKIYSFANGINEQSILTNVQVYPNPSAGNWELENFSKQALQLKLFDAMGKLLSITKTTATKTAIMGSQLTTGVYYLEISLGNGQKTTRKLVKQ